MSYDPLQNPIDFVIVAGRRTPGITKVVGADSPRKWDERVGPGLSGSSSVYLGNRLARPEFHIRLYTSQDWEDWYAFKPIVDRAPNGKFPRVLDVVHPWLRDAGIKAVGIENILSPEEIDNGGSLIVIKCIAHSRLKLALAKPEGAVVVPPPADPYDIVINNLTNQLNELARS